MKLYALRRRAFRAGYLLRKSRSRNPADPGFGLYVLVEDTAGNRGPRVSGAQASALADGAGDTLPGIAAQLEALGF